MPLSCDMIGPKTSMKQGPRRKNYLLLILIYCTLLIKLCLYWPPRVRTQPSSRVQMKQKHAGLALVLHQVKSWCISIFQAYEYLRHLVPLLLFSCCLPTSGSSTAPLSWTWRKGGPDLVPLAPHRAASSRWQTQTTGWRLSKKISSPPYHKSVPEQPVDNMSLIRRTQIVSKM